jgi:hypothetical protein
MTASRAVAAIGGTALLIAWIAAAADSARVSRVVVVVRERPRDLTRAEQIANDIQSQATRLRARLASAPAPAAEGRNPFRFSEPATPRAAHRVTAASLPEIAEADSAEAAPVTIPLTLSGIAEDNSPEGTIRTAVLSGLGDVFLVKAGDVIASRFQITAIGADAVEILDTSTGATVRLGLR